MRDTKRNFFPEKPFRIRIKSCRTAGLPSWPSQRSHFQESDGRTVVTTRTSILGTNACKSLLCACVTRLEVLDEEERGQSYWLALAQIELSQHGCRRSSW